MLWIYVVPAASAGEASQNSRRSTFNYGWDILPSFVGWSRFQTLWARHPLKEKVR
jgi:hypothetical protein